MDTNKKYNVIYADPPWSFKTYSDKGKDKSADNHYECQDIDWISNLPVQQISDENCILFICFSTFSNNMLVKATSSGPCIFGFTI